MESRNAPIRRKLLACSLEFVLVLVPRLTQAQVASCGWEGGFSPGAWRHELQDPKFLQTAEGDHCFVVEYVYAFHFYIHLIFEGDFAAQ